MTVAALYIDARGPYPTMPGVDAWDVTRDARKYAGPFPIVAHPPCGPWGRLRHLYKGNERDCAPRAVEQVRRWGGVLEHPAGSLLWSVLGLPHVWGACGNDPCTDNSGGYTIEVDQVEWGHVARKRTWLYLVGVPRSALEAPPFPGREPTHWCSGRRTPFTGKTKGAPPGLAPAGIKFCSNQQRRRTPPLFAEYLVSLAAAAAKERAA